MSDAEELAKEIAELPDMVAFRMTNSARTLIVTALEGVAENAALRKDAGRYRWLRERARTETGEPWIARSFLWGMSAWTGEHADAAIDAAIAQDKK